jgi:stage III sporulation protein AD
MVVKLALIAIVFAVVILYLKTVNPELAILASIGASIIFVSISLDLLGDLFGLYERLASIGGISESSLKIVFKVIIIAYIVEFSAGIIEEFGMKSLSDKLVFVGKIIIVLLAVPVFEGVVSVIEGLL